MTTDSVDFAVLAYGPDERLHREATVALLTLKAFAPTDARVCVLTDRPPLYEWISGHVSVEPLAPGTLRAWRGPSDDRFRPKLETLRHLAARGGHVVLVDSDTMAQAPLAPLVEHLAGGGFLLYEREYPIAHPPRRGDRPLRHEIVGKRWAGFAADEHVWMWNGGVIGISARHPDVPARALAAYDDMRQASKHFALEQLAYSIVFPAYGPVRATTDCFVHYWANRAWFDRRIDRFLSAALMQRLTAADASERLRAQPITGARDGRLSSWQRRVTALFRIEMDE